MAEMETRTLLKGYRIREAFSQFIDVQPLDGQSLILYQRILGINWNLFKLHDSAAMMKVRAAEGEPVFQYAWARYNDAVRPSPDSVELAIEFYRKAEQAGIPDATMCLAYLWNEGAFGQVDREKYRTMMQKAVEAGSEMAALQSLRDRVWGNNGQKKEPREVYGQVTDFLERAGGSHQDIAPQYYTIVGCTCEELGRSLEAYTWYKEAYSAGDPKACMKMAVLSGGFDDDGHVIRVDDFMSIVEDGMAKGVADCELYPMYTIPEKAVAGWTDEQRERISADIRQHLERAFNMGESTGAFFMGNNYQNGLYGFEKDKEQAWIWYSRGAARNHCFCLQAMADMILNDEAPSGYDYDFMYNCELGALRFGYDDTLVNVVRAYQQGHLTEYSAEIERYYVPVYEELYEEDDFEGSSDEDLQRICP